jgi:hypothetical protein
LKLNAVLSPFSSRFACRCSCQVGQRRVEGFSESFAQRLARARFDLRNDPVSILGGLEEPYEQHGLADAAQPVEHYGLGGSCTLNAVE